MAQAQMVHGTTYVTPDSKRNPDDDRSGFIGLKDLTSASMLATKRQDAENLRMVQKRDWALNRAFYQGQQWAFWNPKMLRVEDIPTDAGPKWKVRLQSNQIKPGLANYVAMLTKTRPVITAEPDSGSDTDVKAAQMGESLFDWLWDDKQLNSKLASGLFEAGLSGGYWKITWDALASTPMTFTIGPDGAPIQDEDIASVFIDQLAQEIAQSAQQDPQAAQQLQASGMSPEDLARKLANKTVYLGDIRIDVMTSENVLLDPAANSFEEAVWVICKHNMDPDELEARWGRPNGEKIQPNAIRSTDSPAPLPFVEDRKPPTTLREVFIMYIRPCPALPDGRYVAWVEGPNVILEDRVWPYPFRKLPLVKIPGLYRPNSPYDDPIVTEARSLQKDYNKTLSQIVEHKNLTLRPQMLAPVGSIKQQLTTEPGAVWEYNPVANQVPQWRDMPALPAYVFEHLATIKGSLDDLFMRVPTNRDQLPARTDTGTVLEGMAEAVSDQLSTIVTNLEDSLALAGELMAALAQEYYIEDRLIKIRGQGGSVQVKKFKGADIAGGFTFRPRYGTGLPRTRAGKQAAIIDLVTAQLIDPKTAMKHLDLADLKGVQAKLAADEDQAYREHDKLMRGEPINPAAIQNTQQQIQQMIAEAQQGQVVVDPTTGQPIDPQLLPQQFQQMMQSAMNAPTDYEDWEAHLDTHGAYMKTQAFENLPLDVQARFLDHFNQTFQRVIDVRKASLAFEPSLKPKVTIQAKATTSPQVMGEILRDQGIEVSDQDVAAPPLDTWVTDDLTKPDVQESGNTHMDDLSKAWDMLTMKTQADADLAQTAQTSTQAAIASTQQEQSGQMDLELKAQKARHLEDMHQQKLAHTQEKHQSSLQQARQAAAQRAATAKSGGGSK